MESFRDINQELISDMLHLGTLNHPSGDVTSLDMQVENSEAIHTVAEFCILLGGGQLINGFGVINQT